MPQWTIGPGPARRPPDLLMFDLDPGEGATIVECAQVAERLYDSLVADGLSPLAETSGSKGMSFRLIGRGTKTLSPACRRGTG